MRDTADGNVNVLDDHYLHPTDSPRFYVRQSPPQLVIELSESLVDGMNTTPANYAKVMRSIHEQTLHWLAAHVHWLNYDGPIIIDGVTVEAKD